MKSLERIILILLVIHVFVGFACTDSGDETILIDDESLMIMDKIHFKKLVEFSFWFIETGLGEYYKRKDTEVYEPKEEHPKWFKNYGDSVWIHDYIKNQSYNGGLPEIERNGTIARFSPTFKGLINLTECFLRTKYNNELYEYWVIKLWKDGSKYRDVKFVLTKAKTLDSKRAIIYVTSQFIEQYEINNEFSVVFPKELDVLYRLKAWIFLNNFRSSDLRSFKVILLKNGEYKTVPIKAG